MATYRPFWVRWGLSPRRVAAWAAGAGSLAAATGVIAGSAQHAAVVAARPETADLFTYSLLGHVAAMTLLGAFGVLVASALVRARQRSAAAVVLVATAAGPMTLVAAPVSWSLVAPSSMDTVWWWHAVVAAGVCVVLAGWTAAVLVTARRPVERRAAPDDVVSDGLVFAVVAIAAFAGCWNFAWHLQESPGALPALGWALLAAGAAVAAGRGGWRTTVLTLVAAGVTLGAMSWAYLRQGGWPGVAGWEFNGMESPVILSLRVAVVVTAAPLLGATVGALRRAGTRRGSRPDGAAPGAAPA